MEQEKTYKWIQERLRDLQSGRITDADRLQLDEMAKTDPFLSDALEGYRKHPHIDHSTRLNTIAHRIRVKKEVKRKWLMPAIAASLLAVAGIWTLVDLTSRENTILVSADTAEPASTEGLREEQPLMSGSETDDETSIATVEEGAQDPAGLRAHAESKMLLKAEAPADAAQKETMTAASSVRESEEHAYSEPPASESTVADDQPQPAAAVLSTPQDAAVKMTDADEGLYANQMDPSFMQKRVRGQILNVKGEPLFGAMIGIPATNLITTADYYGRFEVFLPSPKADLEINLPGYQDTIVSANQGQEDLIVLLKEEGNVYQDISQAYSKTKTREKTEATAGASPVQKTQVFPDYLKSNSKFPVLDQLMPGSKVVRLEFSVNNAHRPENIRVTSSSGSRKHDEEALRLVREGPDWLCGEGYPCVVGYSIFFR